LFVFGDGEDGLFGESREVQAVLQAKHDGVSLFGFDCFRAP
jgi:hypothetical protein